jgi:hypothetical protein
MYRNCIFCSAPLGSNEAIELFPVGEQLAFDSWRGRLWVVCPSCARWNLSPIEERWETLEVAEKLFRDARLRVQSENIGLARLPDGTRLVRVGEAVAGELAAWRYGTQLRQRHKRYVIASSALIGTSVAAWVGVPAIGVGASFVGLGYAWYHKRRRQRVVFRAPDADGAEGSGIIIRGWHVEGMSLQPGDGGALEVQVRDAHLEKPRQSTVDPASSDIVVVSGDAAHGLLRRAMVHVNRQGASQRSLDDANRILADAGSAHSILQEAAHGRAALGGKATIMWNGQASVAPSILAGPDALAFEMALNEESERCALEGELAALTAAWREAEEIAAIADALPGEATLNRWINRLAR